MPNRLCITSIFCLCLLCFLPEKVGAQNCQLNYEMLTKLYVPDLGAYTVWDEVYDGGGETRFITALPHDGHDNAVIAMGERHAYRGGTPQLLFVAYDYRGKVMWEKQHDVAGLVTVHKMVPYGHGDNAGYLVLATRKTGQGRVAAWLGFFDRQARLKATRIISDSKFNIAAHDIIPSIASDGWLLSVAATPENVPKTSNKYNKNAVLYLLDKTGREVSSRSYVVGGDNELTYLSVSKTGAKTGSYIATGYIENKNEKKTAWVLALDTDLSLHWQRSFSRGVSAKIMRSFGYDKRYVVTFGDVMPSGGAPMGSWAMMLDRNSGEIVWQRYYYGETGMHNYWAQGAYVNDDGLITLMMRAEYMPKYMKDKAAGINEGGDMPLSLKHMDYAHVLTLNPRGVTLYGDAFTSERGATLLSIQNGRKNQRIMAGYVPVKHQKERVDHNVDHNKVDAPVNAPLKEYGNVNLPDAPLSDETRKGLALLQKNINADKEEHHENRVDGNENDSVKIKNSYEKKAWILIGAASEPYNDPCR